MTFPASPSLDQQFTFGGRTWKWNGRAWAFVPAPASAGGGDRFYFHPSSIQPLRVFIDATSLGPLFQDSVGTLGPLTAGGQTVGLVTPLGGMNVSGNSDAGPRVSLIQATAANRPTWTLNSVNGAPALVFDGVNDVMTQSGWAESATAWPASSGGSTASWAFYGSFGHTIMFLGQIQAAAAPNANYWNETPIITSSGSNIGIYASTSGGSGLNIRAALFDSGSNSRVATVQGQTATPYLITQRWLNGTLGIRLNGGAWSTVAAPLRFAAADSAYQLGNGGFAQFANIHLAASAVWSRGLSDFELLYVERYLGQLVGLTMP